MKPIRQTEDGALIYSSREPTGAGSQLLKSAALAGGLIGSTVAGHWAFKNLEVPVRADSLDYLNRGLNSFSTTPWWQVAGMQADSKVKLGHYALNQVKRFEEQFGGIPRTFGVFEMLNRSVLDSPQGYLHVPSTSIKSQQDFYKRLLAMSGQTLTAKDIADGLEVRPHGSGRALFRVGEATPLATDVNVNVKLWAVEGAGLVDSSGQLRHQHIMRDMDSVLEFMNLGKLNKQDRFPYIVTTNPIEYKTTGPTRAILEELVDVDRFDSWVTDSSSPATLRRIQRAQVFSKRMTERYMRVLDQPLEFVQEMVGRFSGSDSTVIDQAIRSRGYSYFKNIFGTGGKYKGTATALWGRHALRAGAIYAAGALAYEAGSAVTNVLFDKNLTQVGAEAVASGERLYAGVSDVTGLTSLSQAQEEEARGSTSLLGLAAFPLSGMISGQLAASLYGKYGMPHKFGWEAVREEVYEVPKMLKKLGDIPVIGSLFKGKKTLGGRWGAVGAAIGGALVLPFLPGAIGSGRTYEEVAAEQRGDVEIARKKGAMWEMGRSEFEGGKIEFYTPHWYRRMMDDPTEELQFGDLSDRPFTRLLKGVTDPYWNEKRLYYKRPYAVTGADSSGFGPLGAVWASTIGSIFKPTAYMHLEDATATGDVGDAGVSALAGGDVARVVAPRGADARDVPVGDLGGEGYSRVRTPDDPLYRVGDVARRTMDAIGLPGFVMGSLWEGAGGANLGLEAPVLASFSDVGSMTDRFWDLGIGGGYGTTEAVRRFLPKKDFRVQELNPVENEMPSWLPGSNYFTDFSRGDPYAKVALGEYRLPGEGYASRFKELEGVDPELYPNVHKIRILGDVAMYSREYDEMKSRTKSELEAGKLSEYEQDLYYSTLQQEEFKRRGAEFTDPEDMGIIGGYWESLKTVGRMNPFEHLIPFSPVHKFSGPISAIETYKDREVYSLENPDWSNPIEDFVAPAVQSAGRMVGIDPIPASVMKRRDMTEYLDKLEWMRAKRAEADSRRLGMGKQAFSAASRAKGTMFGADPFADIGTVERVLPKRERAYFREFVAEDDPGRRAEILSLVPDYTKKFYIGQWQKKAYTAMAVKGDLSDEEVEVMRHIEAARALEGQTASTNEFAEYYEKVQSGDVRRDSFASYMRAKEAARYFQEDAPLPGPSADWVGYDQRMVMDDIKLQVVKSEGMDYHDFDLWDEREAALASKPYIEEAVQQLAASNTQDQEELRRALTAMRMEDISISVIHTGMESDSVSIDLQTDRSGKYERVLSELGYRKELSSNG